MIVLCALLLAVFTPEAAFRQALKSDAEWTMERRLAGSERTLKSSGSVSCRMGQGIVWKTLKPFESSVTMTTNAMIFADEDGTRTKPLSELPYYAEIRERTDAFAAGKADAFDGLFELERVLLPEGGWQVTLRPEFAAMRQLMSEVVLTGDRLPTKVVMRMGDGSESQISFKERAGDR